MINDTRLPLFPIDTEFKIETEQAKEFHKKTENVVDHQIPLEPAIDTNNYDKKHLKGYIYDSLVFRYQIALNRGLNDRVSELMTIGRTKGEATEKAIRENNRDLMRFCMILSEAIGEHD